MLTIMSAYVSIVTVLCLQNELQHVQMQLGVAGSKFHKLTRPWSHSRRESCVVAYTLHSLVNIYPFCL